MLIRPATSDDAPAIWSIVGPTIRAGETYALPRDMSEADALSYWMGSDRQTFVAVADGSLELTTCVPTRREAATMWPTAATSPTRQLPGRVSPGPWQSIRLSWPDRAAMQFNFVVSTNERAVRLWQSLGFEIVGRLPLAFRHPSLGYVDALVMFQAL